MIHLFYVESYFHLLVADQIINTKQLSIADCRFVTERGTVLPERYANGLLYDGSKTGFKDRIKFYYKEGRKWKDLYAGEEICAYLPFQFFFPSRRYFAKYCFFEEGFSAYSPRNIVSEPSRRRKGFLKGILIDFLLPFSNKNVKGLVAGVSCDSVRPINTRLYRLSDDAYKGIDLKTSLSVETVGTKFLRPFSQSDIKNSVVVVADRISSKGRPFDDETYLKVLQKVINDIAVGNKAVYIKLHPADHKNDEAKQRVLSALSSHNPLFITENLENLAVCNNNNLFVGSNSTVLYYAPILGDTNRSVSFAKRLADNDELYRSFLKGWGGTEEFCKLFGKQVKCI